MRLGHLRKKFENSAGCPRTLGLKDLGAEGVRVIPDGVSGLDGRTLPTMDEHRTLLSEVKAFVGVTRTLPGVKGLLAAVALALSVEAFFFLLVAYDAATRGPYS